MHPYDRLEKNSANYTPLSPLTFIERSASVFPDRTALIHGSRRQTWAMTYERCRRLASALHVRGVARNDTVAVMLPNTPEMYEAHFGIPMSGAVINALNTRLDAEAIAFMLEHGEAKVLIADSEYATVVQSALDRLADKPLLVVVNDPLFDADTRSDWHGDTHYEALLDEGDPNFEWVLPPDEWNAIALGYTSGTTGNPKGVVTHHRGAYLNAVANIMAWQMGKHPVYLWTLPMFHCNGWCFPWTLAAMAGTSVCLRTVRTDAIFERLQTERVDYLCGAPIVLSLLKNAPEALKATIDHRVKIMTAASAPPAAILEAMAQMGFDVTHVYGLTEVYGPAVVCEWKSQWDELPIADQAALKARQGVRYPMLEALDVLDPDTMEPVQADAQTIGEIMFRGNIVMKGYLKNADATDAAFAGGWFHSGDLAVKHPDGYVEIKDRSKDIIISGGENISSIEIENVLYRHPDIAEAAVVAMPDEKWGETPCAFVELNEGSSSCDESSVLAFCRERLAHFKAPKRVVFGPLPKTSTGKIQKFELRQRAADLAQ